MATPEPGWYPVDGGKLRYWDGNQWTEHYQEAVQEEVSSIGVSFSQTQEGTPEETVYQETETQTQTYMGTPTENPSVVVQVQQPTMHHMSALLPTNRSFVAFVLLGILTLGIYNIWAIAQMADDLNLVASRADGKRTSNYWLIALLLGPITLGIAYFVWWTNFSSRIGTIQMSRGMRKTVSGSLFWLWGVLGSLVIVGPFIFMYFVIEAMNQINADYNARGDSAYMRPAY